jgi:3-dehydroquinate synthase
VTWRIEIPGSRGPSVVVGGEGALALLEERARAVAKEARRLFVITDANVAECWGSAVLALLREACTPERVLIVPAGEATKSVERAGAAWEWLAGMGARRDDLVVAVGGGVVGDLAGFVASSYLRGVALWQIATSLLAQVDSSVGGKTAVNLGAGKNMVGSFYQPDFVVVDPVFLRTLPTVEYRNGLGEVVKYGLLVGEALFSRLERSAPALARRDPEPLEGVIQACVAYKAEVVAADETDRGGRAVLNLGHTTAHALEKALGFGRIGHGVAVGLGLLVSLAIGEEVLDADPGLLRRTVRLLGTLGLPTRLELPPDRDLVAAIGSDKKVSGKGLGFVGLRAVGEPVWGVDVSAESLVRAFTVIRM